MRRISMGVGATALAAALAVAGCGTGTRPDPTPSFATSVPTDIDGAISVDQARTIATQLVVGGTVTEVESDDENNIPVWKVNVVDPDGVRHRISVDKQTGQVLVNERE